MLLGLISDLFLSGVGLILYMAIALTAVMGLFVLGAFGQKALDRLGLVLDRFRRRHQSD